MKKYSDTQLMKLITQKNTPALKEVYGRYEKQIFNFITRYTGSRELARELIQETFTRVWFSAHTFDLKRGKFKGWLYTIALNIARTEMSRKEYTYHFSEVTESSDGSYDDDGPAAETPEALHRRRELQRMVSVALGKLKPFLREVVIMKNHQHLKFREIAEITGMPVGTLKARYHRAVEQLKQEFKYLEGR